MKKNRKEVGREAQVVLLADAALGDIVPNEQDHRLQKARDTCRGRCAALRIAAGHADEDHAHEHDAEDERGRVLGEAEVQDRLGSGFVLRTMGIGNDKLVLMVQGVGTEVPLVSGAVRQVPAAEELQAFRGLQDNGQGEMGMSPEVPIVAVADVLHDELTGIEFFFRVGITMSLPSGSFMAMVLCRERPRHRCSEQRESRAHKGFPEKYRGCVPFHCGRESRH